MRKSDPLERARVSKATARLHHFGDAMPPARRPQQEMRRTHSDESGLVATAPQLSPKPAGSPQLPDTAPPLLPPPPAPLSGRPSFVAPLSRQASGHTPGGHARSMSDVGHLSERLSELNQSATYT